MACAAWIQSSNKCIQGGRIEPEQSLTKCTQGGRIEPVQSLTKCTPGSGIDPEQTQEDHYTSHQRGSYIIFLLMLLPMLVLTVILVVGTIDSNKALIDMQTAKSAITDFIQLADLVSKLEVCMLHVPP